MENISFGSIQMLQRAKDMDVYLVEFLNYYYFKTNQRNTIYIFI